VLAESLRVELSGARIAASLDGKRYVEIDDLHVAGGGSRRLDQADGVTAFDDSHGVTRF